MSVYTVTALRRELEQAIWPKGVPADQMPLLAILEQTLTAAYRAGQDSANFFGGDEWSNGACLGYAILGAQRLGYNADQTQRLVRAINGQFDFKAVEEAQQTYNNSPY
ncbi:hypothetical protein [Paenibacillus sp. NRS-1780]|uniref:hypothetical protein n=1 Tax=Paenibacillus sp. NRS-1780 TaxID=3233904 RepID=UPI003D2DAED8